MDFEVVLLALVNGAQPIARELAELESRLAIELTLAKQYREGGKVCFGFLDGVKGGDFYLLRDKSGYGSNASLPIHIRHENVRGLDA
jgi:hypothetical protein